MKQINRLLIMLTLLCIIGLASSGVAVADSVRFGLNNENLVTLWSQPDGAWNTNPSIGSRPITSGVTILSDVAPTGASLSGAFPRWHGADFLGWYRYEDTKLSTGINRIPINDTVTAVPSNTILQDGDVFYAIWAYNIRYSINPGTGSIVLPASPVRHYLFEDPNLFVASLPDTYGSWNIVGWYDSPSFTIEWGSSSFLMPTNSEPEPYIIILHAKLESSAAAGSVRFASNNYHTVLWGQPDGAWNTNPVVGSIPIISGVTTLGSVAPTNLGTRWNGSTFLGWYKAEDVKPSLTSVNHIPINGAVTAVNPSTILYDGDVFYGIWAYEMYYLIDTGSGPLTSLPIKHYLNEDPQGFVDLHLPDTHGGWDIVGWYGDSSFTNEWGSSSFTMPTSSVPPTIELYAKMESNVTLNANGGAFSGGPTHNITITPSTTVSVFNTALTAAYNDLQVPSGWAKNNGWYSTVSASGVVNDASLMTFTSVPAPESTFYAKIDRQITAHSNTGSSSSTPITVQYNHNVNDMVSLIGSLPAYGSWTHEGWYLTLIGAQYVDVSSQMNPTSTLGNILTPTSNNVYMGWFGDINLNANGGTGLSVPTFKVQPGQTYSNIESALGTASGFSGMTRSGGWDATGWYKSINSGIVTNPVAGSDTFSVGDTLYVGWFGDIALDENGGTGISATTFEVQPGQPYSDIETALDAIAATSSYGSWAADWWYLTLNASEYVDDTSMVTGTDIFNVGDTLYIGWFGDIALDENGGTGISATTFEVQPGQPYSDIETALDAIAATSSYGSWAADWWYLTLNASEYVDDTSMVTAADFFNVGDILYIGWFGDIALDENGGTGISATTFEVQPGQPYSDIETALDAIAATSSNGAWNPDWWYLTLDAGNSVDVSSLLTVGTHLFDVGDTLYMGWFNDIFLDANGGEFGSGSSISIIPIEVQFSQTYGDLVPLIAAELAGAAPEYGRLIPKMWYLTQISGNVPYVDTSSFLDLTDPATLSILADGSEIFFVGWSHPSSGGSGTGGAIIVGNNTTQTRPIPETEGSGNSDGSGNSNGSGSSDGSGNSDGLGSSDGSDNSDGLGNSDSSDSSDGSGSSGGFFRGLLNSLGLLNDAESQTAKKSSTWLPIILIVILILILCGGYYYFRVMKK